MTGMIANARLWLMRPSVLTATLIVIGGIAVRLPFVLIPPAPSGLYNVDELALALSVVDRWLGLPPINLCWPGIPSIDGSGCRRSICVGRVFRFSCFCLWRLHRNFYGPLRPTAAWWG
jgi:hypothetical protein